ncbi:hypothetical protein CI105_09365 [Candidatus Izimaplasma bacterium ZiA1]|nr:hypothetical protein CI105_09365 [Candidatus Izimaplasma bacterium ZiA1]
MPAAWKGRSGRVWGKRGKWPVKPGLTFHIDDSAYFQYRRIVRSWRIADARSEENPQNRAWRIRSAKKMLKCSDRALSEVRGTNEWISEANTFRIIAYLAAGGCEVYSA